MWVARFKLRDDQDIYSPLCIKFNVEFFAYPYTNFVKDKKIHLLLGGIISGNEQNKKKFLEQLRKDKRIISIEVHNDFIVIHAVHPISRESEAEIRIFYNPQYIRVKPVHLTSDGWEYWEVACIDRDELNKLVNAALKNYHGKLLSMKNEKLKSVASVEMMPLLTEKQLEALRVAHHEGYYNYPRRLTLPKLAKITKKSYSTFQEHLSKAENKLIDYFLKYR
jgi:predicted DNA binding protein